MSESWVRVTDRNLGPLIARTHTSVSRFVGESLTWVTFVMVVARLYPWAVEPSDKLETALATLDTTIPPAAVVRAGYGIGLVVGALAGIGTLRILGWMAIPIALGCGGLVTHLSHETPCLIAEVKRTTALGDAPALVSRAVMRMHLTPTPEQAAVFAARAGDGLLADDLDQHIRRARYTGLPAFASFGQAWAEQFPSLNRALQLVTAAGQAPTTDRERLLDRALDAVLDGTRERMRAFAADIRGPTTALYAFGVLLPTALVALLPAAATAGIGIAPASVVFAYNLFLPGVLIGTSAWLLAQRPVAFPPPDVTEHPDVTVAAAAPVAGGTVAIAAWLLTAQWFPGWAPPIAAAGLGCGVTLWLRYRPVVAVYEEIEAAERELGDAMALTGRRVAAGRAVETAIEQTAPELDGPLGTVLENCTRRQRQLQVGVDEALRGTDGALTRLPSPRLRTSMGLLALAATEGKPAGEALLALSDHIDELRRIEREAVHDLAHVCQTLSSTAMVFGPLVAGATVALADGMAGAAFGRGEVSLEWLGAPVGFYALALAVILTGLSTGLRSGLDPRLVGYRAGKSLTVATCTYLVAYLFVGGIA